jgi:ribonuclease HI
MVKTNSKIVVNQIEKRVSTAIVPLAVRSLAKYFRNFMIQHVDRDKNEESDILAKTLAKGEPLHQKYSMKS